MNNLLSEKEILLLVHEFKKFYNLKENEEYINYEIKIEFMKKLNLKTQTQQEIALIFLSGCQAMYNIYLSLKEKDK